MEHNIGVGVILGLATASSIYVWKTNGFTKVQKTFLLLFLIFPPLQWISILLVLCYNKFQQHHILRSTNTIQNKSQSIKIKDNLKDLRESGLLTQSEYYQKIQDINNKGLNSEILNSDEYLKLKQLFDSNILSENEFNEKVKLLLEIKNVKSIEQKPQEFHIHDSVENDRTVDKGNEWEEKSWIYVVLSLIFLMSLSLINWNEVTGEIDNYLDKNNEQIVNEPSITTTPAVAIENDVDIINSYQRKFVYIVITAKEPKLIHYNGYYIDPPSGVGSGKYIEDTDYVKYDTITYSTEIKEISDYNEDKKNMLLDKTEDEVSQKINMSSNFQMDLFTKCHDANTRDKLKEENPPKIIDRQIYEFDNYTDASLNKQAKKNLTN